MSDFNQRSKNELDLDMTFVTQKRLNSFSRLYIHVLTVIPKSSTISKKLKNIVFSLIKMRPYLIKIVS